MKTKIKRHSRSVISVILAVCMLISCMTVGIIATDAAKVGSEKLGSSGTTTTGHKTYVCPVDIWSDFNYSTDEVRLNLKLDSNPEEWKSFAYVDTGNTVDGKPLFCAEFEEKWGGADTIQVQRYVNNGWNAQKTPKTSFTNIDVYEDLLFTSNDDWVSFTIDPTEDTQTVTAVASPSTGAGTVSPASADAGENAVKATFTAAPLDGFDVNWTLGSNLTFAESTTASDTTIKVNVLDDTVSDATANKATANFVHKDVELHLGTTEGDWNISKKGDFKATGTNVFEYDTGSQELTAGTKYYLYVTTKDATQTSGTYYKGAANTHPTLSTTTNATVERVGHNNNFGGRNGSVVFEPTETGAYTFTFDPVALTISVRSSFDMNNQGYYSLTGNVTDKYIVGSTLVKPAGINENKWWSQYHTETAINNKVEDGKFSITFTTTDYKDGNGVCADIGFAGILRCK